MKLQRRISRQFQAFASKYPDPIVFAEEVLQRARRLPQETRSYFGIRRLPRGAKPASADSALDVLPFEVVELVETGRSRLWFEFIIAFLVRLILIGLMAVVVASIAQLITPLPIPITLFWAVPVVLFLVALVLGIRNRPTDWQAAKLVDRRLGLRQRVSTAMELLAKPVQTPIERIQIDDAIATVRALRGEHRVPVQWPGQEFRLLSSVLGVALLLTVVTSVFNFSLLRPSPERQQLIAEAARAEQIQRELEERGIEATSEPQTLAGTVNQLIRRVTGQSTDADTLAQLNDAQTMLANEVSNSFNKEQALSHLAYAWQESSATKSIADELFRGEYEQAASELHNLADRLGDLSMEALEEMARGLEEAAAHSQAYDEQLAHTMQQAAEELKRATDPQAQQNQRAQQNAMERARDRLHELGQQTQEVADAVAARDQLTDALQDLEMTSDALAQVMGMPDDGMFPGMDMGEMPEGFGGSEGGDAMGGYDGPEGGDPSAPRPGEVKSAHSQERSSALSQVGGPKSQMAREQTPHENTVEVRPPRIEGRNQESQTQTPDPNARPEIGRGGREAVSGGITGKINATPDLNAVPWQFRALVRDYFSNLEARTP